MVESFEALGIDYMISGSQASMYYGEPRFTQDIDVVADLNVSQVPGLLARFPLPEFYVSEDAVRGAVAERGQFRPEDVILYKLIYYRDGASERHLRDVAGILRVSGSEIDLEYIDAWAGRLDLADIWSAVRRRLGER